MNYLSTLSPIEEKDELNRIESSSQRLDFYKNCKLSTSGSAENLSVKSFSLGGEKVYQKQNKVFFNKCVNFYFLIYFYNHFFNFYKQFCKLKKKYFVVDFFVLVTTFKL